MESVVAFGEGLVARLEDLNELRLFHETTSDLPDEQTEGPIHAYAHLHCERREPERNRQRRPRAEMDGRLQNSRTKKRVRQRVRDGGFAP